MTFARLTSLTILASPSDASRFLNRSCPPRADTHRAIQAQTVSQGSQTNRHRKLPVGLRHQRPWNLENPIQLAEPQRSASHRACRAIGQDSPRRSRNTDDPCEIPFGCGLRTWLCTCSRPILSNGLAPTCPHGSACRIGREIGHWSRQTVSQASIRFDGRASLRQGRARAKGDLGRLLTRGKRRFATARR